MKNHTSYCLPGWHVELGEDTRTAILREMLEEIDTPVSIYKELAIVENFYLDKKNFQTHELSFYYIVVPEDWCNIPLENYTKTENDKGEIKCHNFEWLDISSLNALDFRPEFIKEKFINKDYHFEHIIIK